MRKSTIRCLTVLLAAGLVTRGGFAETETDPDEAARQVELAKKSQNPVADIISIPFEFWHHEGENGNGFVGIVKPEERRGLGRGRVGPRNTGTS